MSVEHGIEGKPICPAGGEVEDVDLAVRPGGLAYPAQQDRSDCYVGNTYISVTAASIFNPIWKGSLTYVSN